jgi:multisubunit Na+/H+ antiporter MnhE subunit
MNANAIIYTSSDYKIAISANGITVPLSIVESVDFGAKKESEYIHAIGTDEPMGLKTNTSTYPGKISMEAGEFEAFLIALGYVFGTQVVDATIAVVTFDGILVKVFKGIVFDSDDRSIKAKDKRSLVTLDFKAVGVAGI